MKSTKKDNSVVYKKGPHGPVQSFVRHKTNENKPEYRRFLPWKSDNTPPISPDREDLCICEFNQESQLWSLWAVQVFCTDKKRVLPIRSGAVWEVEHNLINVIRIVWLYQGVRGEV